MLYNKFAVKNTKPVTKEQITLARKYNPFKADKELRQNILDYFKSPKKELDKIESLAWKSAYSMNYDYLHTFKGIRTGKEAWSGREGHCIELAVNLKTILSVFGVKTKWLVMKNPKGFEIEGLEDWGVHPFLIYDNGKSLFQIEANNGTVRPLKEKGNYIAKADMSFREFIAFWLHDGGEDLGFCHEEHDRGLDMLNLSLKINPNDYTTYCTIGTIHALKQDHGGAEKAFQKAIRIAPNLIDPHKAYGDYLFNTYKSPEFAVTEYKKALSKSTDDSQILNTLEKRLKHIGEKRLAEKTRKKKNLVLQKENFNLYFSPNNSIWW